MSLKIIQAEYLSEYKIKLIFNDNKEVIVNFENFLKSSHNPMTKKYLDIIYFKEFKIEYGDLVWNDYELCFPIIDLYENNISKSNYVAA